MSCTQENCTAKELVIRVEARLDRIETKIDDLDAFRWKIIGGSGLLAALISFLLNK